MRFRLRRSLAFLIVLTILCQVFTGCSNDGSSNNSFGISSKENVIVEQYLNEEVIEEEELQDTYIIENLIYDSGIYEYNISENIISQAYVIEIVVGETSEDEILQLLPEEISEYDIDWVKVISQFAVGTAIIITVGIVKHFSAGSTFFVFGSPVTVAKDALVGAVISAAMNEVIGCIRDGKITQKAATKYLVEGFADGYMWGAISSVLEIFSKNFKRLNSFKLAKGGKANIKIDGSVFDDAGQYIGKAYYDKDDIWYILNERSQTIHTFDSAGNEIASVAASKLPANSKLRLGLDDTAQICYTDDAGKIIRLDDELLPNISYKLNRYTYYTDKYGRITKVVFDDLQLKPSGIARLDISDSKSKIGKGFERPKDDRGHLIADIFNGDNNLSNIVSMDGSVNKGEYKTIESILQKKLQEGGHVSGFIEVFWSGTSYRPDSFCYSYDIGDGLISTFISNR